MQQGLLALLALVSVGGVLGGCQPSAPAPTSPTGVQGSEERLATAPLLAHLAGTLVADAAGDWHWQPDLSGAAVGDGFHEVGLTDTLTRTFAGAFTVRGVRRSEPGVLELDLQAKHPFPIEQRPDLHAFNIKVHLESPSTGFLGIYSADPGRLLNADGYSRLWATQSAGWIDLLPYLVLSPDLSHGPFDPAAPAGWNVFAAGSTHQGTLRVKIPEIGNSLSLQLYLTADFGQSATLSTRQTPVYTLPDFAGKAPWRVATTLLSSDLGAGAPETQAEYRLQIYHWTEGAGLNRDVLRPVRVAVPDLQPDLELATFTGTGLEPTPLTTSFGVSNYYGVGEGIFWGFVEVRTASEEGMALQDDLVTPFTISEYSTWQLFPVEVGEAPPVGEPPVPVIARPCFAVPLVVDREVVFDATGTTDPEDAPDDLTYEWDPDYNGGKFLPGASGKTTVWQYQTSGPKTLALAVTDSDFNRVLLTIDLVVRDPGWSDSATLYSLTGQPLLLSEASMVADSLFFAPDASPWLLTRPLPPPAVQTRLLHPGSACPPVPFSLPLDLPVLPDVVVRDGEAYVLYQESPTLLRSARINLTAPSLQDVATVFESGTLLAGSLITDRALVIDPSTGNLMAAAALRNGTTAESEIWAAEKNPQGVWSVPFFVASRDGSLPENTAELALAMSAGSVICAWADLPEGGTSLQQRELWYARSSFGVGAFEEPAATDLPLGSATDLVLRSAPDSGLLGVLAAPALQYVRFDPFTPDWTQTPLGNLSGAGWDPRCVVNDAGQVTALWVHQPEGEERHRLVSKAFAYDAPAGEIGSGSIEIVQDLTTDWLVDPQIGVAAGSDLLAAAWIAYDSSLPPANQVWRVQLATR